AAYRIGRGQSAEGPRKSPSRAALAHLALSRAGSAIHSPRLGNIIVIAWAYRRSAAALLGRQPAAVAIVSRLVIVVFRFALCLLARYALPSIIIVELGTHRRALTVPAWRRSTLDPGHAETEFPEGSHPAIVASTASFVLAHVANSWRKRNSPISSIPHLV